MKNAKSKAAVSEAVSISESAKLSVPIQPLLLVPNIKPKPTNQKNNEPNEISITFFIIILIEFFALVAPASNNANPACIRKTNTVANKTQTISRYIGLKVSIL
tara:strand:- start:8353 stop:8661 length:309 start_codon:yes stop_codon:yes gene_type:complete